MSPLLGTEVTRSTALGVWATAGYRVVMRFLQRAFACIEMVEEESRILEILAFLDQQVSCEHGVAQVGWLTLLTLSGRSRNCFRKVRLLQHATVVYLL